MVHVTCLRPSQGRFVIRGQGQAIINLPIKFEVSIFTRYEYINSDIKCGKWDGLG